MFEKIFAAAYQDHVTRAKQEGFKPLTLSQYANIAAKACSEG
jgi:hypothetical protein